MSSAQQEQLLIWAEELKVIRDSNLPVIRKSMKALEITKSHGVIAPLLKQLFIELKRLGWDERTWVGKLGISGSVTGLLLLNTATGGFAAFGTAIAVPLWMVVGAGGLILGQLIESLKRNKTEWRPPDDDEDI
jgi:hypothetical protein